MDIRISESVPVAEGDNVLLFKNAVVVAVGCIQSVSSSALCHGVVIGPNRVSVKVLTAISYSDILPYPSIGADNVSEAVNSFVLWDRSNIQVIGKKPTLHTPDEGIATNSSNSTTTPLADSVKGSPPNLALCVSSGPSSANDSQASTFPNRPSLRPEQELYFKVRKNWSNVGVTLLSKVEGDHLAEGIIFLPFAKSCIDGEEVGEENAGVLVSNLCEGVDPSLVERDLPGFIPEDPRTVRWPILRLRVIANDTILGQLYKAYVDADAPRITQNEAEEEGMKKKRSYNSVKRSKPDPATIAKKKLAQRSTQKLSAESITKALAFVCSCKNECMRKVSRKDILEERQYFLGEPYSKRIEYILSKFDHPGWESGKMLFVHGQTVCKPAFWTIYGFVRQTFYNYEAAFKLGQRVGFHGNQGEHCSCQLYPFELKGGKVRTLSLTFPPSSVSLHFSLNYLL